MGPEFEFRVIGLEWDVDNDNIDVEVIVDKTERYVPTFFTMRNIESLLGKYRASGECASGTYFWAADLIVIRDLKLETIRTAVQTLVETGEIRSGWS